MVLGDHNPEWQLGVAQVVHSDARPANGVVGAQDVHHLGNGKVGLGGAPQHLRSDVGELTRLKAERLPKVKHVMVRHPGCVEGLGLVDHVALCTLALDLGDLLFGFGHT